MLRTERLHLRPWMIKDVPSLAAINADPRVMEHYPRTLNKRETDAQVRRFRAHHKEHGFCYFAAEQHADKRVVGFVGLARQDFPAYFTPCVDIGWRLHPEVWGQGLALEGARACLAHAFETLQLGEVIAVTTHRNLPSIRIMQQLGMHYRGAFIHPRLPPRSRLQPCLVYAATSDRKDDGDGEPAEISAD
ncbi:GNAT family N-acetyltransferase [Lewinella sp. JB7]|uniref:GNAT family N-acetyltransferase n=1 Tax=Lewinella sp. JB7 TaxID=2962887 RepID=UPI0020C9D2B6|nr:GNAT family N-acetyltransferase [Lewinella sp. JB7]MCP9234915.1 GNAT family N-acetyltransferase [Lewinella sp. JB7]